MRNYIGYLLPFFMVLNVKASGNHGSEGWLGLNVFMGIILFVTIFVYSGLYFLRNYLKIQEAKLWKSLTITAMITIIVNSVLFGYVYRDVIF